MPRSGVNRDENASPVPRLMTDSRKTSSTRTQHGSITDEHGANTDDPGPPRQRYGPSPTDPGPCRTQHGVNTDDPGPPRTISDALRTVPDRPKPNTDRPGPSRIRSISVSTELLFCLFLILAAGTVL